MNEMYADGGVIGRNPSATGGTWAWCQVNAQGERIAEGSGVITPFEARMETITNNLTELLALVNGLESLPEGWKGTVYSDSSCSLQRVFEAARLNNLPRWLIDRLQTIQRSGKLRGVSYVLLDGHPTRAHLEAGRGKRGGPVSIHNVWCDKACGQLAQAYK